jgi:hypothetical protein
MDGFEADLMERNSTGTEFTLTRMVPPTNVKYYYKILKDGDEPFPM